MCYNPRIIIRIPDCLRETAMRSFCKYAPELLNVLFKRRVVYISDIQAMPNYRKYTEHEVLRLYCYCVPCGKCLQCLASRRNDWTTRCLLESKYHKQTLFVTLTYRDEDLPPCLIRKHYQDFMKRLRAWNERQNQPKLRQFYCGEYGEARNRPHFHAIVFGLELPDLEVLWWTNGKRKIKHAERGYYPCYTSKTLEHLWSHGYVFVEYAERQSMKYVANYLDKGFSPQGFYAPPFKGWSSRPALARQWFEDNACKGIDYCLNLKSQNVPSRSLRYFKRLWLDIEPEDYREYMEFQRAIAMARDKPWIAQGKSEWEYLKECEEVAVRRLQLFGRHKHVFV